MAARIEDELEGADSRVRGPLGVLGFPTLGSFLALEIAMALRFPNRSGSDHLELQNFILGEVRREIQGKNGDLV